MIDNTGKSRHDIEQQQLERRFKKLPHAQKELIREAGAAGLQWRGEDTSLKIETLGGLTHFEHMYREYLDRKRLGIEEYKRSRQLVDRLAGYTRGSGSGTHGG